ncbi:MAG: PLP-dependent aminotransferase family protein [Pseudolabrys sp.]|jgi:DNA-binding transcriptional MocR family regulator
MAIWLPDLSGRRGPKYLQIVEAMAEDIAAGHLQAGARLLPHRELAYRLGLSPHTASRAYAEGTKRALLRGEVGRGTFVRAAQAQPASGNVGDLRRRRSGPIDLSRNLPLPGLAEPHIRRVLNEIAQGDSLHALLDYQTKADLSRHTEATIRWLALCGIAAEAEETVVTNGAQHGLFCILMALLRPGDLFLVETLSYAPVRAMADRLGIKLGAVAMDAEGLRPDALDDICRSSAPKALYLMPTLQTPTTATLSSERRRDIAGIARRHNLLLIEDDVFSLLKPDRPAPIATLAPERTVYVTSVSKCMAPGLRVGHLRAPRALIPALRHSVNLSTWMTPPITSEIAARLILGGTATRLAEEQRNVAAKRQRLARRILKDRHCVSDGHGLHLWLPLPDGWRADLFRRAAEKQGVLVADAQSFAANPANSPEAIRICLSHETSEARLEQGLSAIKTLLGLPPTRSDMII